MGFDQSIIYDPELPYEESTRYCDKGQINKLKAIY